MDPKQQALVLGYAVPMPVVVRTRAFDADFYRAVGDLGWTEDIQKAPQAIKDEMAERAEIAGRELFG